MGSIRGGGDGTFGGDGVSARADSLCAVCAARRHAALVTVVSAEESVGLSVVDGGDNGGAPTALEADGGNGGGDGGGVRADCHTADMHAITLPPYVPCLSDCYLSVPSVGSSCRFHLMAAGESACL